jgi:rubrerythrin
MYSSFQDVIDFALECEIESVNFYKHLQLIAKQKPTISFLKELEEMEMEHVAILNSLKPEDASQNNLKTTIDLKISDYLVEPVIKPDSIYQEILLVAIKREEAAHNLYLRLASESSLGSVCRTFMKIASEEALHKLKLETVYDNEILKEN